METVSPKHERIFNVLSHLARDVRDFGSSRLAAAIVHKNDIVGFGINQRKSHPFQAKYSKNPHSIYLHAEISAIHNALKNLEVEDLKRSSLYVCRVKYTSEWKKHMIFANSCPCPGCMRAICDFGIKNVYHTIDLGYKKL
jgi:deoxycytidylate deaminase